MVLDNELRHLNTIAESGVGLYDPCSSLPTRDTLQFYENCSVKTPKRAMLFIHFSTALTRQRLLPEPDAKQFSVDGLLFFYRTLSKLIQSVFSSLTATVLSKGCTNVPPAHDGKTRSPITCFSPLT